jgi:hypothetical protein
MESLSTTTTTSSAIDECTRMTAALKVELEKRKIEKADYDAREAEYQRRKGLLSAARALYSNKCSGNCAQGGVARFGCDPMCTNMSVMNPELVEPTAPVWGSLGNFVCTVCNQAVDIDATAGGDLTIAENAIAQQMQCVSSLATGAAAEAAEDAEDDQMTEAGDPSSETADAASSSSSSMVIVIIIIIVIIAALIAAITLVFIYGDDESDTMDIGGASSRRHSRT